MFRFFGLMVGIVSTGYFAFFFWQIIRGVTVNLSEPNAVVAAFELLMAIGGLGVLLTALIAEIVQWR